MAELISRDTNRGSQLVIAGEDIPFGAYQAIYHSLTKKVEQRSKAYKGAYTISFADLQNLHARLTQAIKQYDVKSSRCQVTHQFVDETAREHSSFEKFRSSDMQTRSSSSQIAYEFDFLVVLPAEIPEAKEIAQRYKVFLGLEQDNLEVDLDQAFFMRSFTRERNVNLSIEFADYAVSQALYSVVDCWVASLPIVHRGSFFTALSTMEKPMRFYASSIARIITLFGGAFAAFQSATVREALFSIMVFFAFSVLLETITAALINRAYENVGQTRPLLALLFTQGDQDRIEIVSKKQKRRVARAKFMFFGVIVALIVSVLSSAIYDSLKGYFI